ncbi:MAG: type II secretion system protein [Phycisphaeraceae bacterium]|nr:type II secretion system protein [Phycisphaeraceae bacterium]
MKKNFLKKRSHHKGFTLLEVLLAMGIFAIGFVFIAAIFPVAALLQKEAADIVNAQQIKRDLDAIMTSIQIFADNGTTTDVKSGLPVAFQTDQQIYPANPDWLDSLSTNKYWPLGIRSFPSYISPDTINTPTTPLIKRKFFTVPLFLDTNSAAGVAASGVVAKVFVMIRKNASYPKNPTLKSPTNIPLSFTTADCANSVNDDYVPKVFKIEATNNGTATFKIKSATDNIDRDNNGDPDLIDQGDIILDNNGNDYTVIEVSDDGQTLTVDTTILTYPQAITHLWFAYPGEEVTNKPSRKNSPAILITTITGVAK